MLKHILNIVLVLAVIILSVWLARQRSEQASTPTKEPTQNTAFEKKKLCASYKPEIRAELADDWENATLDEVFFSTERDSCLYTASKISGNTSAPIFVWSLYDYFTNEVIYTKAFFTGIDEGSRVDTRLDFEDAVDTYR